MTAKKNKILIWSVIIGIIILAGIIMGIIIYKKNYSITKTPSPISNSNIREENKLNNLLSKDISKENEDSEKELEKIITSDLYKEFEELPEEKKEQTEVIPREANIPFEKIEEIKEDQKNLSNTIPDKFNLSDKINIKVDDQGTHGLCWAFTSINALESHLALKNLGDYDFSEMHLDYMESSLLYGYRPIHTGGNFSIFEDYLTRYGVVLESQVPYRLDNYPENEYKNFININKATEVIKTINFPSFYKNDNNDYSEEQIKEFRNSVKRHIMTNGGLFSVIATPDAGTKYYNPTNCAECFKNGTWDDIPRGLHAVTIIGWDDNYSKDNFQDMKPDNDGAYIAVNSWSDSWGKNGYFYISYEDMYVESDLAGIVSTSIKDAYKLSSITNPAIKDYLNNYYKEYYIDYNGENYITPLAINHVYSLDLSDKDISSLKDIEIFNNLFSLYAANNNITDISPITKLSNLTMIDLSNNNISDISPLGKSTAKDIYSLILSNNKIKDISVLNKLHLAEYAEINLSGNKNITNFENLPDINSLCLSDCNLKDLSIFKDFKNLITLDISNSPEAKNIELLPKTITILTANNCNITSLTQIDNSNIIYLYLKDNKLTNLNGIEKYKYLSELDISNNKITDWSNLNQLSLEKNPDYEFEEEPYVTLFANNCDISDITVFNNQNNIYTLFLKDNKITDLSNFKPSKNLFYIDLSGNKNLNAINKLNEITYISLNNCNISSTNEISKLKSVEILSLDDNNITDISELSKLSNLTVLSLARNKNLSGSISNNKLLNLNLENCNINNIENFIKVKNLYELNVKGNKTKNISNIINSLNQTYIDLYIDEIDENEIYKITNKSISIFDAIITMNVNLKDNNIIDLTNNKLLSAEDYNYYKIENGTFNKDHIVINDKTKGYIEFSPQYATKQIPNSSNYYRFYNTTFKLIFDNSLIDNTNTINNSTNTTNTINQVENSIINNVENIVKNNTNEIKNNEIKNNIDSNYNQIQNEISSNTITNNIIENTL